MDRRKFVSSLGLSMAATAVPIKLLANEEFEFSFNSMGEFTEHIFPDLPYSYDALEPHIDKLTMEIHYDRHHRGYYKKFMAAIKDTEASEIPLSKIFSKMSTFSTALRNSAGGFYNHTLFWNNMSPKKSKPSEDLVTAIEETFGSFDIFKEKFSASAASRFGSGWAWLVLTHDKKLSIGSTPNQDNPLMDDAGFKGFPLLTIDVWEHAYYLNYQNKRGDYIGAFWNVINWNEVNKRFEKALMA